MHPYAEPPPVRVEAQSVGMPGGSVALVYGVDTATGERVDVAAEPRMAADLAAAIEADGPQLVTVARWQVVARYTPPAAL